MAPTIASFVRLILICMLFNQFFWLKSWPKHAIFTNFLARTNAMLSLWLGDSIRDIYYTDCLNLHQHFSCKLSTPPYQTFGSSSATRIDAILQLEQQWVIKILLLVFIGERTMVTTFLWQVSLVWFTCFLGFGSHPLSVHVVFGPYLFRTSSVLNLFV
jgi:uncharacterized membrane protein